MANQDAIIPEVLTPQQLWFLTSNQTSNEIKPRKPTIREAEDDFNLMLKESDNPVKTLGFWERIHKVVYSETIINSNVQKQRVSITKAALRDFKDVQDGQILINQIQVVHEAKKDPNEGNLEEDEILLWHIIKKLPSPKIINLRRFAFHVCIKKYQEKKYGFTELSRFLQMQRTYISRIKSELAEEGVFTHRKKKKNQKKKQLALVQAEETNV